MIQSNRLVHWIRIWLWPYSRLHSYVFLRLLPLLSSVQVHRILLGGSLAPIPVQARLLLGVAESRLISFVFMNGLLMLLLLLRRRRAHKYLSVSVGLDLVY